MNDTPKTRPAFAGKTRAMLTIGAVAMLASLFGLLGAAQPEQKNERMLVVAVRRLPEYLSPATAWTNAEKQTLPLLFESLVEPAGETPGARYRPNLATQLPAGDGLQIPLRLRPGARWSDGAPVTAADVRHTYALLADRAPAWNDLYELPRLQSPTEIAWTNRQGLFDPWSALTQSIVPQQYRGKPLTDPSDPQFGKGPIGSGRFVLVGREKRLGRETVILRRNPHRADAKEPKRVAEIHFVAWNDADKDLPALAAHVVLDAAAGDLKALRAQRYMVHASRPPRVYYLAINHRRPALAQVGLRRALALAIDRAALLQSAGGEGDSAAAAVNGPFPAQSWAVAPAPRVPATLHQPELARSLAKESAKTAGEVNLTLACSDDVKWDIEACAAIAKQWTQTFEAAGLKSTIRSVALAPHALRSALEKRDFEVALCSIDDASAMLPLTLLFDPHPSALKPGGANFLGYANDAKLQSLLASIHAHRQFSVRRALVHDLHAHLIDTMPLIPLWQLPLPVALQPTATAPDFDARRVFADLDRWQLK